MAQINTAILNQDTLEECILVRLFHDISFDYKISNFKDKNFGVKHHEASFGNKAIMNFIAQILSGLTDHVFNSSNNRDFLIKISIVGEYKKDDTNREAKLFVRNSEFFTVKSLDDFYDNNLFKKMYNLQSKLKAMKNLKAL
jgi:hypothetical protein